MTDLTKLADALEELRCELYTTTGNSDKTASLHKAERILRSAAGVDVAGLMALADELVGASAEEDIAPFDKARAALESALRLVLAQREWQPIETAPRDGRQLILLLTPSGFPQVAYSNTWWTAGFSVECKPTHWMPLPAAAPKGTK